jgi:DNA primase small subunit
MSSIIVKCVSFLDVASELHDKWQGNRRSSISKEDVNATRWEQLKSTLQSGKHKGLRRCIEEIVFSYTYPRLDMEVKAKRSTAHVCSKS